VHKYLPIALNKYEHVSGLALTDDGNTYVTNLRRFKSCLAISFNRLAGPSSGSTTHLCRVSWRGLFFTEATAHGWCSARAAVFSLAFATVKR